MRMSNHPLSHFDHEYIHHKAILTSVDQRKRIGTVERESRVSDREKRTYPYVVYRLRIASTFDEDVTKYGDEESKLEMRPFWDTGENPDMCRTTRQDDVFTYEVVQTLMSAPQIEEQMREFIAAFQKNNFWLDLQTVDV